MRVKYSVKFPYISVKHFVQCYSESGSSVPCKFKDYLKIDFDDWMTIRILLCYFLASHPNVAFVAERMKDSNRNSFPWKPQ